LVVDALRESSAILPADAVSGYEKDGPEREWHGACLQRVYRTDVACLRELVEDALIAPGLIFRSHGVAPSTVRGCAQDGHGIATLADEGSLAARLGEPS